jgi:hypothetical protein
VVFHRILIVVGCLFLGACQKSALPLPPMGPNENTSVTIVPYPPPAARAEIIPPKPGNRVVWVDGLWIWDRRRWIWQRGRWEVPPTRGHYAASKLVYLPDGTLGWYPGGWQTPNAGNENNAAANRND